MNTPRMVWTLLALGALAGFSASNCAAAPVNEELSAAVAWYDSLEWPDVRGKPYVEVTLADSKTELRRRSRRQVRGFLLDEDDQAYHLFCDGVTQRILKSPAEADGDLPATVRELGPTATVEDELKELRHPKGQYPPEISVPAFTGPSERSRTYRHIFVLARCFARQSRTDLAEKLDQELATWINKVSLNLISPETNLRASLEKWIASDLMGEAIKDFGDMSLTRSQLLRPFERLVRDFSGSDQAKVASEFVERLRLMIAEDKVHARTMKPLEAMTQEEKAREWIFRLRNETGLQRSASLVPDWKETGSFIRAPLRPGSLLVRAPLGPSGGADSPAQQLIQLGPATVPALIAALGDQSLTRSVAFRYGMLQEPRTAILTVGDCAETVLYYIAGRHFGNDSGHHPSSPNDDRLEALRAQAQAWWRERQANGEKQMLIEGVRSAGADSLEQARHLVALDPLAAVPAIIGAIESATSLNRRTDLIRELSAIKSEAATQALRDLMNHGAHLGARVSAAAGLWQRGEMDAVPAMLHEWSGWKPSTSPYVPNDEETEALQLIDFLASCGESEAIKALTRRFPSLPVETKFLVLNSGSYTRSESGEGERPLQSPEFNALREEMIVQALDDKKRRFRLSGNFHGVSLRNPRVCDIAACAMAEFWPARYTFKGGVTRFERDVQIAALRNTWRSSHGLTPLAPPISASHDAVGLAEARNVVVGCQWSGGPPLAEMPVAVGKLLTADDLMQTVLALHHHLPRGCTGFIFSVERARNQSGIMVEIEWLDEPHPESPSREECLTYLRWDEHTSFSIFPAEGPEPGTDPKDNASVREQLNRVLRRDVAQPLSVLCSWSWQRTLVDPPL